MTTIGPQVLVGKILLPDFSGTCEGAVVIDGNLICDVLYENDSIPEKYHDARVIDCTGKMIIPGFHDSHTHILQGSLAEEGAMLRNAKSEEEAAEILHDEITSKEYGLTWILGGGWDHFKWPGRQMPSKESLDKYFPDTPVFLLNKECHGAWVNSQALSYFNINRDTSDPENGEIYRDRNGDPTGYLHEDAALDLVSLIYEVSDFEHLKLVKKFCRRSAENGITSVSDMQIYGIMKYHAVKELENRGELTVRVHFCPPIDEKIVKLKFLEKSFQSDIVKFSGAKGFIDGTPMGYTGLMIDGYDDRPNFFGATTIPAEKLEKTIILLDEAGIRCRLHACGDGAVRLALDIIEKARIKNGEKDIRHTIEHIECLKEEDADRFYQLGVIASVQPDHMPKYDFPNHPFHDILGESRAKEAWPFATLERSGAMLSFGTDYPIAPLNPLRGIYRAVTRLTDDFPPEKGFSSEERISISSAIRAYTLGSAYCNFRENELGTIEEGKLADLTILSEDLFEINPERIKEVKVDMTIFDGKIVYSRDLVGEKI